MEYYYVNYFNELKGWSREEQLNILVKAKHCTFKEKGLLGKYIIFTILIAALGLLIIVPGTVLLVVAPTEQGYISSIILRSLLFAGGVLFSMMIYRKMYGSLLRQGLLSVLNDKDETSQ